MTLLLPFDRDPCRRSGGQATSLAAFHLRDRTTDRREILGVLDRCGAQGLTLDEASAALGRPPNALSGRFTELAEAGVIVRSGVTRQTRAGGRAAVWVRT